MIHDSRTHGRTPFLDTLTDEARTAIEQLGTRRCYHRNEVLIHEGAHTDELMVIQHGVVKVTGTLEGRRPSLMDIRISGDLVGETAALDHRPRSATVTACGEVIAIVLSGAELEQFLQSDPGTTWALCQELTRRLRRSDRLRLEFGNYPVRVRLARALVELADSYGKPGIWNTEVRRINVNLTQDELASLVGCGPSAAHKVLTGFREDDLIDTGPRQTDVYDLPALRKIARPDKSAP